jgi:hypothetical protein
MSLLLNKKVDQGLVKLTDGPQLSNSDVGTAHSLFSVSFYVSFPLKKIDPPTDHNRFGSSLRL